MVAYVANALAGTASLAGFDPAEGDQHVVNDTGLRMTSANTTFERLWWGRDGTQQITARVWLPDGAEIAPLASWRHDGTTWLRTSDRISGAHLRSADVVESRDLDGGWALVLSRAGELRILRRFLSSAEPVSSDRG